MAVAVAMGNVWMWRTAGETAAGSVGETAAVYDSSRDDHELKFLVFASLPLCVPCHPSESQSWLL